MAPDRYKSHSLTNIRIVRPPSFKKTSFQLVRCVNFACELFIIMVMFFLFVVA